MHINVDGVPFSIDKERVLHCQYGKHYLRKRNQLVNSKDFKAENKWAVRPS